MDRRLLIQRYLIGELSEAEVSDLDKSLIEDPKLRRELVVAAAIDTELRNVALEQTIEPAKMTAPLQKRSRSLGLVPSARSCGRRRTSRELTTRSQRTHRRMAAAGRSLSA